MTNQDLRGIILNFSLPTLFPQICRIRDWSLFTARGRQFNPEDSGFSGTCGPDCYRAADIEDLSHWWENQAGKPETAGENYVRNQRGETHLTFQ